MSEDQTFLTAKQWTQIVAHAWLDPEFQNDLEVDPAQAIEREYRNNPAHGWQYQYIVRLPENPGYEVNDLLAAVKGDIPIIPCPSFVLHGP